MTIKILKFEWKRMIHSKTLILSVLVGAVLSCLDVAWWYKAYKEGLDVHTSVFYKWAGVNQNHGLNLYLYTLIPLLSAFAYSWTVAYDRSTGYITQVITRIGRAKYFLSKYIVTFISGGMVFVSALLFNYMLLSTFSYNYQPWQSDMVSTVQAGNFGAALFYQNVSLFFLFWCFVAFLWGGAMACIGMAAGMLVKNRIITSVVPFLVFTGETLLGAYIMGKYSIVTNSRAIEIVWTNMFFLATAGITPTDYYLLTLGVVILIPTIIYVMRARKYECL